MKKTLFSLLLACAFLAGNSQSMRTCGSTQINSQLMAAHPEYQKAKQDLETFTQHYIQNLPLAKKDRGTVYRVPVVVHVIHNGESVGTGPNITAAQIMSQLAVLNKDYRLLNSDSLLPTHPFWPNTDDCEIEFCLATLDPTGHGTTGIERINGGQSSYTENDVDFNIKPNTTWDNTRYLNIWTCTFGGTASGLLGYSTQPGAPADYDGVVIGAEYFGTTGSVVAPYNKGRTGSHEVGHFFNLEHVWGDATCGDDFVSDTPVAYDANGGCPSFPHNANGIKCAATGPNGEMYMNYMDYTDDACMKMFTTGQKNRMRATFAAGQPRNSLLTSNGCTWPSSVKEVEETKFSVFPNPSTNHFYIRSNQDFSSNATVHIYNAIGQELSNVVNVTRETNSRFYVNVKALTNGTYFLKVNDDRASFSKSITIVK